MRQKKVMPVSIGVIAVLAVVLFAFSCDRSADHHMDGDHMMDDNEMHHEGEDEHMHDEHGEADTTGAADPSGTVVDGTRVVQVKARQFEFDPATIVVRQGESVRLEVTSQDVTHGLSIEGYDINEQLPPNETVAIEFTAGEPGAHHMHCSVYCGEGHEDMHGELRVLPRE